MKQLIILFILINSAFAQKIPEPDADVWKLGKKYYSFHRDSETKALISFNCKKNCEAKKAVINKAKVRLSEEDRAGGKNPGAVICTKIYSGEVLVLKNVANNENAFCKFKDKSIVSVSDLF